MLVLCYKRCSTCQKALKWLTAHGIEYTERPIIDEKPTLDELKEWSAKTGLPLKKMFNTSGVLYKEYNLKDKLTGMSDEEMLTLLASDGRLVKRPLVILDNRVLVGFKEAEWEEQLL